MSLIYLSVTYFTVGQIDSVSAPEALLIRFTCWSRRQLSDLCNSLEGG